MGALYSWAALDHVRRVSDLLITARASLETAQADLDDLRTFDVPDDIDVSAWQIAIESALTELEPLTEVVVPQPERFEKLLIEQDNAPEQR